MNGCPGGSVTTRELAALKAAKALSQRRKWGVLALRRKHLVSLNVERKALTPEKCLLALVDAVPG